MRDNNGTTTADNRSEERMNTVVQRSIKRTVVGNGQELVDSGIQVTCEIKDFWIDKDVNLFAIEVMGQIDCDLVFSTDSDPLYCNEGARSHSVSVGVGDAARISIGNV